MPHRLRLLLLSCAVTVSLTMSAQEATSSLAAHLAAAREAQAQSNCHRAAQEYHAAVQQVPANAELRTNEAIALYCDAQLEPAINTLHAALRLKSTLTTPHLFLGLASFRLGRLDTARQELTLYLEQAPADLTAHLWLGYTLAAQGRNTEAETAFETVLAAKPADPDAEYALGQAALGVASQKARELQAIDPGGTRLLELAAEHYRATGDATRARAAEDEATKRLRTADAAAPQEPTAARLAGEAQAAQAKALAAFQTILETSPDTFRAHEVLADALLASHQEQAAIAEYETVIRLNPGLPGVHEALSECLVTTGRFAEALTALNAERAISPVTSARLLTRIGQAEHATGQEDAAAKTLNLAVQDPAAPPQAYLLLAQVHLAQGHADKALPLLHHFLELRPDSSAGFYTLSRVYRTLGDRPAVTQALANFQRTSQDARARALMAPLTNASATASFAETPSDSPDIPQSSAIH